MSDLNWCPVCDKAIPADSTSLYCSIECLQYEAIHNNPMLGYKFEQFQNFLVTHEKRCKQQQCFWRNLPRHNKATSFVHPHPPTSSSCLALLLPASIVQTTLSEHAAAPAR
ncbi:hypothetical protein VTP01DRAFT_4238 [Rhizomucor pusillus]|uniref:uncharacterized protein n=1 Tax=Rhizomucor pusillus TaxID=4840 RepID=UPI00374251B3